MGESVALSTVQRLARAEQLRRDGVLVSDWEALSAFERATYPAMVAAMERAGVPTDGRPPVWAWSGVPTPLDITSLLDPEHQLSAGYALIEFAAPDGLVFLSDYGSWNDYLAAWFDDPEAVWAPGQPAEFTRLPQACVPYLRGEWVRTVRPLPTSGWEDV
ncbi:hypothetical protein [Prauserella flavalba]|nr:hypothetical protein [Prauserella flavalba]